MRKAVLPPACYTEQSWFDLEQEKIFGQLWLFAGFAHQLTEDNSFITRRLNGVPVLVQNFKGEIKAFRNACAHRGMPIQTEPFGTRKAICPYHGWGYDGQGALRGVPNGTLYEMCQAEKDAIRLQAFAVQTVGIFVFVNLSAQPIDLSAQYTVAALEILEVMSRSAAPQVSYTHFEKNFNWKLNFENVIDPNHVQFIHPASFAPLIEYEPSGAFAARGIEDSRWFGPEGDLNHLDLPAVVSGLGDTDLPHISQITRSSMPHQPRWFSPLIDRADTGAIVNLRLFPNLNIGSLQGETFFVQQFSPVSPDRTEVHSWVFTAQLADGVAFQPQLLWGMHHAEMSVLQEDAFLLTQLQEALKSADSVGLFGAQEGPLAAMGLWYLNHLTGTTEQ
ncbi:aromatic ring-hydroxylating dioxygenase subunit alpha [Pseudomonas sp. dw_358]|uniref:aromatic ring-hydroxylating oxygenase subunit alpha n=1 Tax=Pseudomonas sp. dw_358 TaxID=2720083 RepID=UPI001BD36561|nr:aromatic ring-hydroxylating dioxygenase subunit alpha [Pseudomonas sp. dw_358]